MKVKISIIVDADLDKEADEAVKEGHFRNKSHILEYALKSYLKGDKLG
jgi:Arc/MetJ-type ribon-helix-helix transcriptional regulator